MQAVDSSRAMGPWGELLALIAVNVSFSDCFSSASHNLTNPTNDVEEYDYFSSAPDELQHCDTET